MHDITRVWLQRLPHPIAANILCYQETCASTNIELFFSQEFIILSLGGYALACGPNMTAALLAFCAME